MAGARMAAVGAAWKGTWARMGRTKHLATDVMQTPLNRCLSTLDITLLGQSICSLYVVARLIA